MQKKLLEFKSRNFEISFIAQKIAIQILRIKVFEIQN